LYSYLLCLLVMLALRVIADLFINMDEFAELELPFGQLVVYVSGYYFYNVLVYFQELGGVILVAAAAFSLARMNRTNELTAILASGTSLHRVIMPVIMAGMALSLTGAANQELIIPRVKDRLVRARDDVPGTEQFKVRLVNDGLRNVWYSRVFYPNAKRMIHPLIIARDKRLKLTARITGSEAVYQADGTWRIPNAAVSLATRPGAGRTDVTTSFVPASLSPKMLAAAAGAQQDPTGIIISYDRVDLAAGALIRPEFKVLADPTDHVADPEVVATIRAPRAIYGPAGTSEQESGYHLVGESGDDTAPADRGALYLASDLTPEELVLRQSGRWLEYMSSSEIDALMRLGKSPDPASASLIKHLRFTNPIANLIMLLIGLPFILSRERNIKASALLCVVTIGGFYVFLVLCRTLGTAWLDPTIAAWLPILVFGPVAVVMLDSIKT